jgi:EXLDI family protein
MYLTSDCPQTGNPGFSFACYQVSHSLESVEIHGLEEIKVMQSESSNNTNASTQSGLKEITVIVNRQGAHRRKRFMGQLLVRWLQPTNNEEGTEILNVYRTGGKQYALHTRTISDWDFSEGDPDYWGNPDNWGVKNGILKSLMGFGWDWETFKESGNYSLQVFKTDEDLRAHVSDDLYKAVSQAMDGPEIEQLDI